MLSHLLEPAVRLLVLLSDPVSVEGGVETAKLVWLALAVIRGQVVNELGGHVCVLVASAY